MKSENSKKLSRFVLRFMKVVIKRISTSDTVKKRVFANHKVVKIGNDAYKITEGLIFNSYLFVGNDSAMLIDTGFGIKGLKETVEHITDKQLIVAVTNSHVGSSGGAGQFDRVYVHKKDIKDAKRWNGYKLRKLLFNIFPAKYLAKISDGDLIEEEGNFVPFGRRSEFNLGGRTIKVVHTPSYTKGSCCFKDSETGIVISGNVALPVSLMIFPHSATMYEYERSLAKLLNMADYNGKIYSLSGFKPLDRNRTNDLREMALNAVACGNDYTKFIRLRVSDDHKRFLVYFPAKTRRRKLWQRLKTIHS